MNNQTTNTIKQKLQALSTYSFYILLGSLLFACDTEDSLSDDQSKAFIKLYGGAHDQQGNDVKQCPDGGYILTGNSSSPNGGHHHDVLVLKTDAQGNEQWSQHFGEEGNDEAHAIQLTPDGGYIVAGTYTAANNYTDLYLMKLDAGGQEEWNRKIGHPDFNEEGQHLSVTGDGGYIISGTTSQVDTQKNEYDPATDHSDIYIVRLNASGAVLWEQVYGLGGSDRGAAILQNNDGSYTLLGTADAADGNGTALVLVALNHSGNVINAKTINADGAQQAKALQATSDGGFIATGTTLSGPNGGSDALLLKVDQNLVQEWTQYPGNNTDNTGEAVLQTSHGYLLLQSTRDANSTNRSFQLTATDPNGTPLWTESFGDASFDLKPAGIAQSSNGGYVITGTHDFVNNRMVFLIKTDVEGKVVL